MNREEMNDLRKENKKISQELHDMRYKKEIEELQEKYTQVLEVAQERFNRIQKAIEYIKEHSTTTDYKTMKADYNLNMNDLLNILKGE